MDLAANIAAILGGFTAFIAVVAGTIGLLWRKSQRVAQLKWKIDSDLSRLQRYRNQINDKLGLGDLRAPITMKRAIELSKDSQSMAKFGRAIYRTEIYELVEMWDEYSFWYTVLNIGDAPEHPQLDQEVIEELGC